MKQEKMVKSNEKLNSQEQLESVKMGFLHLLEQSNFDDEKKAQIIKCLNLAISLHSDQNRPDGNKYATHVIEVANILLGKFGVLNHNQVNAGLLHDSVEDQSKKIVKLTGENLTSLTDEELRIKALDYISKNISPETARIVLGVTNPDFKNILDKNSSKTENELYWDHVQSNIVYPDIAIVKLADFLTNIVTLDNLPRKLRDRLKIKYKPVIQFFIDRLDDTENPVELTNKQDVLKVLRNILDEWK